MLEELDEGNCLRPAVWAKDKTKKDLCGVSLGCTNFLRPLYLYTKLNQLIAPKNPEDDLKKVKAFKLKGVKVGDKKGDEREYIPPCITCQRFFSGFRSSAVIGNCAEYDVIKNVDPNLRKTKEWKEFESACEHHLVAFNEMNKKISGIEKEISPEQSDEIIKTYFENTRHPKNPKVLQYQLKSAETMRVVLEIIAIDWPLPKKQR